MELFSFSTFFWKFTGVVVWILSDLYWYRCSSDDENYMVFETSTDETYADWWTGQQENITAISSLDVTCQSIHVGDRFLLCVEIFVILVKNIWFFSKMIGHNIETICSDTHYIDKSTFTGEGTKQDLTVFGRDEDNFFHESNQEKLMNRKWNLKNYSHRKTFHIMHRRHLSSPLEVDHRRVSDIL